jgi:prepilin-type N-terminal cleavage/methylation domain-containing protein
MDPAIIQGGQVSRTSARRRRDQGFSMVELMVALVIIAFSLFAIMSMVTHTMALRQAALENETAKEWATARIEEVKSMAFGSIATTYPKNGVSMIGQATTPTADVNAHIINYGKNPPLPSFQNPRAIPVLLTNGAGVLKIHQSNADLVEIVAMVTWKAGRTPGVYTLRSMYAK